MQADFCDSNRIVSCLPVNRATGISSFKPSTSALVQVKGFLSEWHAADDRFIHRMQQGVPGRPARKLHFPLDMQEF